MRKRLLNFLREPTSRNIIINTIGNYLSIIFTIFFVLILTRAMGREDYGILSVLLAISYVLANVLDFGTTATIYSCVPDLYAKKDINLYRFIKSTFYYQSIFSLIAVVLLFFTFPWLDAVFFHTEAPRWVLNLTIVSVLLYIWQNFFTNILLAAHQFMRANIYNNIANVIKTTIILILFFTNTISVGLVIFIFGIVGPLIFFLLILKRNYALIPLIRRTPVERSDFRFSYTATYFLASQFYNFGLRMDLFLMSFFKMKELVGDYGLAQKIILTVIASIVSISQVLSPRFATLTTKQEVKKHFKKGVVYMLVPTGILLILMVMPDVIFTLIFTEKFTYMAGATRSLAFANILIAVGTIPMLFLLYTVRKPRSILYSNIVFFLIISFGSYYLIPTDGIYGPPKAIFLAFLITTAMQIYASWKEYSQLKD
jgi:O-antigen/teichoic acid export membrane protein